MSKCAPGYNSIDNSCFTLKQLISISKKFNKSYPDHKFEIVNDKKYLLKKLNKNMKNKFGCSDELCWLDTKVLKSLKNEVHSAHRPKGPDGKYTWLSTTDINKVLQQYENVYTDFKFLGAVPYDFNELDILEIKNLNLDAFFKKYNKFGLVINLDEHWKSGSHWVALYGNIKKNQIYFFDSFGKKPRPKIRKYIRKILNHMYKKKYNKHINFKSLSNNEFNKFDVRYNKKQHQFKNSECGVYSINFIIRLLHDKESFSDISNNILKDNFMNNCRNTYFRN
uniref:Ubiquitin-like protease family profile domain-containing protein n=1 Tax=Megaviridae environmental sample TaxID=1737588 RepID=A0A5J6VJC5_9VIRU|nr:MAG: hypothetical protein [Megaviridae environmental sample]